MLQQTTVAAVREYFIRFTARWPDVAALAQAADSDVMAEWAGLGYYARARNLLACARAVGGCARQPVGLEEWCEAVVREGEARGGRLDAYTDGSCAKSRAMG
jgi:hypothetical protein